MADPQHDAIRALEVRRHATISTCGLFRYRLTRHWNPDAQAMPFVMLNPSTADASVDDPTIRRCMGFARREGAGGIVVVNLYAFRATDPSRLVLQPDAFGPGNQDVLDEIAIVSAATNTAVVCAWGNGGGHDGHYQADRMLRQGAHLRSLGKPTKSGQPRHPLYVHGDTPLVPFIPTPDPALRARTRHPSDGGAS